MPALELILYPLPKGYREPLPGHAGAVHQNHAQA